MERSNAFLEIGRVISVDPRRYTVDVITESGRTLKSVPFLSPYAKGNHNGQGIYMMPEVDSYTLVMRTVPIGNTLFGAETYCYGFFNPIDNKGSFSGNRELLNPGDVALKTAGHNKVLLTTDGVIWLYSADLAQVRLFPASGNVRDAAGLDHLLQILIENFEFRTSGGSWDWRVNKKEELTNFRYEFRSKPLLEQNPDIMVGNIGGQGPLDDRSYFHTWQRFHYISDEERNIIRISYAEKADGDTEINRFDEEGRRVFYFRENSLGGRERHTINPDTEDPYIKWSEDHLGNKMRQVYDGDGALQHELELKATGETIEHHYKDGELVWSYHRDESGATTKTHYQDGAPTWKQVVGNDGHTQILIPGTGEKANITITPAGEVSVEADNDIAISSKTGRVVIESMVQEVLVKALQKITLDAPEVELSPDAKGQLLLHLAADVFNNHTHDFTVESEDGVISGTTEKPNEEMTSAHWSEKVSSG